MVRPAAKREAVAHLRERFEMSERRACAVIVADRKMIRYRSRRPPETALRTPAARACQRASAVWLSPPIHPAPSRGRALRHQSHLPAPPREEGLAVRKRKARWRAVGTRAPILVATRPNARWSLDFVPRSARRRAPASGCSISSMT